MGDLTNFDGDIGFDIADPEQYLGSDSASGGPLTDDSIFNPLLVYEIAQGIDPPWVVAQRYGMTEFEWKKLVRHKPFLLAVQRYRKDMADTGYTFRMKAQLQAEALLKEAYLMARDPKVPAAVRADLIKWMPKAGGLVDDNRTSAAGMQGGFSININLGDSKAPVVITGTAAPVSEV